MCNRRALQRTLHLAIYACWTFSAVMIMSTTSLSMFNSVGYVGNLAINHDRYCLSHQGAHVASNDAIMTRCLAITLLWIVWIGMEYPYISL